MKLISPLILVFQVLGNMSVNFFIFNLPKETSALEFQAGICESYRAITVHKTETLAKNIENLRLQNSG